MDVESLLVPVSPDDPAGPDLSYSDERGEIERMFERSARESLDDNDWRTATELICAQALLTKDMWLGVYLARAGAKLGDLQLVSNGCALLAGLVERYWGALHPSLDEYGVEGRKAPCESLVRIAEFLGPLKRAELVTHPRLGSFTGDDFVRYLQDGEAAEGYGQFRAAVADTPINELEACTELLRNIAGSLSRVDAVLSAEASAADQTGTNFEPAYEAIDAILAGIAPFVAQPAVDADQSTPDDAANLATTSHADVSTHSKQINSREDVARALDGVIDYYTRHEPSSPISEGLRRIKGWIAMDFMAILRDISPSGVPDAERVLRVRIEEAGGSDMM